MQRRIQKPDRCRVPLQLLEHSGEILPLIRQDFCERLFSLWFRVGQNHFAHGVDAIAFKEHMLGTAKSDTGSTEGEGMSSLFWSVGVGANFHASDLGAPVHQLLEVLIRLTFPSVE